MQFVLSQELAQHNGKPLKRKAFELKNMLNFQMWQGKVVDKIVEIEIIPLLQNNRPIHFETIADKAEQLAKKQFNFSSEQYYKDVSKTEAGNAYCILDVHEVLKPYEEIEVEKVYQTIRQSILNFPETIMPNGKETLLEFLQRRPGRLIPNVENWMNFRFFDTYISPQIDLVFHLKNSSIVIDWKVSDSFLLDAAHQLEVCGIAVHNHIQSKGHPFGKAIGYGDIHLLEVNLLKKEVKRHEFSLEIANQERDYINLSNQDFELMTKGKTWNEIELSQLDRTENINACAMCRFRTLCSYLITNQFKYDESSYSQFVRDTEFA